MKALIALLSLIAASQCNAQLVITDGSIIAGSGVSLTQGGGLPPPNEVGFDVVLHGFFGSLAISNGPVFAGGYLNPFVTGTSPNSLCAIIVNDRNGAAYATACAGVPATPSSTFTVTGPALHITAPGDYTSTFSLFGYLVGFEEGAFGPPAVFIPEISGSGTVTYIFAENSQGLFLERARYRFNTAPEPATLSLFALGLVGVGFMRRRKAMVP